MSTSGSDSSSSSSSSSSSGGSDGHTESLLDAVSLHVSGTAMAAARRRKAAPGRGWGAAAAATAAAAAAAAPAAADGGVETLFGRAQGVKWEGEAEGNVALRHAAYVAAADVVTQAAQALLQDTNQAVFRDVAAFLRAAEPAPDAAVRLVPAAVVYAGLNVADDDVLSVHLADYLRDSL